jgi:hypothetical protein
MAKQRPTEIGDVLILRTGLSYTAYAVGPVVTAGQQDFSHSQQVKHITTLEEALQAAQALVANKGRIYLLDIDTADWSEISEASH